MKSSNHIILARAFQNISLLTYAKCSYELNDNHLSIYHGYKFFLVSTCLCLVSTSIDINHSSVKKKKRKI